MNNNLRNKEAAEQIIARVQKLQSTSQGLWGTMTATEMLRHCNIVHEQLLSPSASSGKRTTIKQYILRWLALYLMPRFPKNAQTPKHLRTKGTIDPAAFEKQKEEFINLVRRFANTNEPIAHYHPYFGNLSTDQWGRSSWKHVDHHLRQFGV